MPTPETPILDDSAVSEIEARPFGAMNVVTVDRVLLTPAERDALCATVKYLRTELSTTKGQWAEMFEKLASALLKQDDLQSQLEQLRAKNERVVISMRVACVEKVKAAGVYHDTQCSCVAPAHGACNCGATRRFNKLVDDLSSLQLEK